MKALSEYDQMRERLIDMIHMVTDKHFRTLIEGQGIRIDWDEVARSMKDENIPSEKFLKPVQTVKVSRFDISPSSILDIDAVAPVIHPAPLDAPKTISAVREDINALIRDVAQDADRYPRAAVGRVVFNRLMGIVEQLAMNIEKVSTPIVINPGMYQTLPYPAPTPFRLEPYTFIGDPVPCVGGTTICSPKSSQSYQAKSEAVAQADGAGWEHPTSTDEFGGFHD